jgi:hypothetical protein
VAHSILEVARELIDSPDAKAAYADDPDAFLAARGLDTLTADELEDAVGFVAESMPAPVARQLAAPADPVADSVPLARVAAATSMEAAVVEAEPGTVDLTALVDPSGQLDLPTDGIADVTAIDAASTGESEQAEAEEAMSENEDAAPPAEVDPGAADGDDAGFGTGATAQSDASESDQSDEDGDTDDAGVALAPEGADIAPPPAFDHDDDGSSVVGPPHTVPGKDDEPPEDDFEDVIV